MAKYAKLRAALQQEKVALAISRVQLQKKCALHEEILPAMGMQAPFEYSYDWTPLNGDKDLLCISGVFHFAVIEVKDGGQRSWH